MDLITRSQWGARKSRGTSYLGSTRGVKVHYTGGNESPAMRTEHGRCVARVRAIQDQHMDDNGWNDIGYSLLVCAHGRVFQGRGVHVLPAANGEGLNSGHYAVCALVGKSGLVEPTPAMLDGICDAIAYLRSAGNAGREIKGHRDGYSTDCPGDRLYAWVKAGAPCPGGGHQDEEGDEVPEYVSVTLGKEQALPAGRWTTVFWGKEASDKTHQHADAGGVSVLNGPAQYGLNAEIRIAGLPAGTDIQVRAVEETPGKATGAEAGPIAEFKASPGDTWCLYTLAADKVAEGKRVRIDVQPFVTSGTIKAATCKISYWR